MIATVRIDFKILFIIVNLPAITDISHRLDHLAVAFQLLAQCADMRIQGTGVAHVVQVPYLREQLFPGINHSGMGKEHAKQLKFFVCKLNALAIHIDSIFVQIYD
mgnify:CR=1 FL=1